MRDTAPRLWMMLSVLGGCGARSGLVPPERDVGRDASVSDASVSDASVSDASVSDASVSDGAAVGCALRLLDGPVAALSHEDGERGPWFGPQVVFRDGAFDAVATLQAEVDDTFSQTRAMRFGYSPGAGFRIAVAPEVLFAALGSTPALVQGDALALCRWPSSGGMAAEVARYRGAYVRLAESRSFIGATGCAGLVAAGDSLLVGTQIVVRRGLPEVWLSRTNREGSGIESLGPALLETPREGVGVGFATHPTSARGYFVSAVRAGGFVELGEVEGPRMGAVRRRRVAGFRHDPTLEGVAPTLAFWPDGDTLSMVPTARASTHRLERVNLSTGARTALDLGTAARPGSAPPALLATPRGLFVAVLHGTESAPASAELELLRVDAGTLSVSARIRVPVPGAAPRGAADGVSLASDGDHLIVHWSGATGAPRVIRQTFLAAFDCL
jgi:hypothetical protein